MNRSISVGVSLALAVLTFFLASGYGMSMEHALLLATIMLMVALWTFEAFSLGTVSLLPLVLFPAFGIAGFVETGTQYFHRILLLFLGGMLLARAVEKTELHRYLAGLLLAKLPHTTLGALTALTWTAGVLSALLSNTAVTLILLPLALALAHHAVSALKPRLLLALAYGAGIGGILTPIGTPPNLIALGFLEKAGVAAPSFILWIVLMLPLVVVLLTLLPFILSLGLHTAPFKPVPVRALKSGQRRLLVILILLIIVLLANTPLQPWYPGLGFDENYVILFFGLLLFFPGLNYLNRGDVLQLPYSILLLFGASFALAFAVISTGLVKTLLPSLSFVASLPRFWMFLVIAAVVSTATQFTSNTALASIAIPLFYEFAQTSSLPPLLLVLIPTIAASFAFMLPIATPPNAIVFASKAVRVSDMILFGFLVTIVAVLLTAVSAAWYWTLFVQ